MSTQSLHVGGDGYSLSSLSKSGGLGIQCAPSVRVERDKMHLQDSDCSQYQNSEKRLPMDMTSFSGSQVDCMPPCYGWNAYIVARYLQHRKFSRCPLLKRLPNPLSLLFLEQQKRTAGSNNDLIATKYFSELLYHLHNQILVSPS